MSPQITIAHRNGNTKALIILGMLFFLFGLVTWVNSVLIPYLKIACELNNFESYLVAFAFYISYFVMALPSSWILRQTGLKNGMAFGLFIMALGALLFIPAAFARSYLLFLTGLFVQGTGLAILQTASNPYITILGPLESAAKRISIMGICNKLAGAIAPIILGMIALKNLDSLKATLLKVDPKEKTAMLDALALRVEFPYLILFVTLLILTAGIYLSGLPDIDAGANNQTHGPDDHNKNSIFQFPHLMLGVLAIFLYVGAEVIAGDTIISYGATQGIPLSIAKFFTTLTLLSMILGYIIGIICIPRYFTQVTALKTSSVLGLILVVACLCTKGYYSVLFVAMMGLANAFIWPSVWPLAIADLGRFTNAGASLLIMGIAGGAVLPLIYGRLADMMNAHQAYIIMAPGYIFILYYAIKGHLLRP